MPPNGPTTRELGRAAGDLTARALNGAFDLLEHGLPTETWLAGLCEWMVGTGDGGCWDR